MTVDIKKFLPESFPPIKTDTGLICYLDGDKDRTLVCIPNADYTEVMAIDITYLLNSCYEAGNALARGVHPNKLNMGLQAYAAQTRMHYNAKLDELERPAPTRRKPRRKGN